MNLPILYVFCISYAIDLGPPGIAHDSLRSYRGLALREVARGLRSLPSGDALTIVRWRPPLRWSWLSYSFEQPTGLTLPAGAPLSLRFSVRQVNRSACEIPVRPLPRRGDIMITASPWRRGGARPEGCGERGILAYPPARCKGGEWDCQLLTKHSESEMLILEEHRTLSK